MDDNSDDACSTESFEGTAAASLHGPDRSVHDGLDRGIEHTDTRLNVTTDVTISGKNFPVRPSPIKYVQVAKTHTNHTYRDFSCMPIDASYEFPARIEQMTFHERLYHMLTLNTARRSLAIDWCCHGRAFHIQNAEYLEHMGILRCHFGFNSVQRFRKQLHNYGYKMLVRSSSNECYYSEVCQSSRDFLLSDPSFLN